MRETLFVYETPDDLGNRMQTPDEEIESALRCCGARRHPFTLIEIGHVAVSLIAETNT